MNVFDIIQLLGGVILAIGYIPQIVQLTCTRSCKDLNLKTYLAMVVGISLMELYAINLVLRDSGLMFLITNSISLLLVIYICLLIIAMRRNQKHSMEKDAYYVSKWDDDSVVITPCKVDVCTKLVYDIQTCVWSPCGIPEEELIIVDGQEFPVFREEERADEFHIA